MKTFPPLYISIPVWVSDINNFYSFCSPASVAQLDARPTVDQVVAHSTLLGRQHSSVEIMKYLQQSFSPFRWFKKDTCQFLEKECEQVLFNRLED